MLPFRVLVVDDHQDAADALVVLLQYLGHEAWASYDGQSAVSLARERQPQLVLLDLMMPDTSGLQLISRLRGLADLQETPIVAVTGFADDEHRQRAIMAGFDAFLAKPCSMDDLQRLLRTIQTV